MWRDPGSSRVVGTWCVSLLLCLHFFHSVLAWTWNPWFQFYISGSCPWEKWENPWKSQDSLWTNWDKCLQPHCWAQGDWLNVCLTDLAPSKGLCWERRPPSERNRGGPAEGGRWMLAKERSADNENMVSCLSGTSLVQGSANFRKGPDSNCFRLCRPCGHYSTPLFECQTIGGNL